MNNRQLPDSDIWFVRAEGRNTLARHFLEQGVVSMGWGIGPIGYDDPIDGIIGRLRKLYPNEKPRTLQSRAAQFKRFNDKMEVGDAVATVSTYQAQGRLCHIGIIRSLLAPVELGPIYDKYGHDYIHRVEWLYQSSPDILSEYTRKRLGIPLTLHRLSAEASAELRYRCS